MARPPAIDDVFSAIGNPRRREIVDVLARGDRIVSELVTELGVTQSTVSEHLSALRRVGLVTATSRGREHVYHLDPAPLKRVTGWISELDAFWDERIARLARVLEEMEKEP